MIRVDIIWAIIAIVVSLGSFVIAWYFYKWIKALPTANAELENVGKLIKDGAFAFLKREYRVLLVFAGCISVLILLFFPHPFWTASDGMMTNLKMMLSYLAGTVISALAGWIGISTATVANMKAASAARDGVPPSFMAGFRGGAVMGMAVVGSSLFGTALLYILFHSFDLEYVDNIVLAFSFGASSLALFAKAGGGIFTKTADIAADLVGKVELGLPEDDPRNPAVIADNVGDNVGDVAGMGADLFDSNVAAIAAALVIALPLGLVGLIFCFGALGLLASMAGVLVAKVGKNGNISAAINNNTYVTCAIFAVLTFVACAIGGYEGRTFSDMMRLWGATMLGLGVGVVIGLVSDYFTGDDKKPVDRVAQACQSGPAFTILTGISYGFLSSCPSLIGIGVAALGSYFLCQPIGDGFAMMGIASASLGMLSIVGMIVSNDAYGPIVDNARGMAEMGGLGEEVLERCDQLDSAGNTAKAITKGFAIGAAGLTVISLLGAFQNIALEAAQAVGKQIASGFDLMNPTVFFGVLVGVSIPAVFSAMLMMGVDKNAQRMVKEIHRQWDSIPGLKEGRDGVRPDYNGCIDIATKGALRELIPAGLVAIVSTVLVGFVGGVDAIGGFLTGNITSGLLIALLMSNAGGLWDNAKKYIESGNYGGKGSDAHKAAVIGDTVGDPFKDTAGPSINTQVTVVSLVSSLAASLFVMYSLF